MSRRSKRVADPDPRHRYPGEVMNLVGHKYGRLSPIRFVRRDDHGRSHWLCKCDCGREKVARADFMRCGSTHSCGCLRKHLEVA